MITDVGEEGHDFTSVTYTIDTQDEEYQLDVLDDVTVTLPACSATHPLIIIRNVINDIDNDTVTIAPAGSDTINGSASNITLEGDYEQYYLLPTSASNWAAFLSPAIEERDYEAKLFFKQNTINETLDANSTFVSQHWLQNISPENIPDSPYTDFFVYKALTGNWCTEDTVIYDEDHNVVTPNTANYLDGLFYFNSEQTKDLYIRGRIFDIYNAAAQLLLRWANSLKLDYSYSSVAGNFSRLERIEQLMNLYMHYKDEARLHSLPSIEYLRDRHWYRYSTKYGNEWIWRV
jgi:hypothetical protein